jgi:hypothetical protein
MLQAREPVNRRGERPGLVMARRRRVERLNRLRNEVSLLVCPALLVLYARRRSPAAWAAPLPSLHRTGTRVAWPSASPSANRLVKGRYADGAKAHTDRGTLAPGTRHPSACRWPGAGCPPPARLARQRPKPRRRRIPTQEGLLRAYPKLTRVPPGAAGWELPEQPGPREVRYSGKEKGHTLKAQALTARTQTLRVPGREARRAGRGVSGRLGGAGGALLVWSAFLSATGRPAG